MTPEVGVIVPALLGVGLLFALGTMARHVLHRMRVGRDFERRASLDGHSSAVLARQGPQAALANRTGLRPRWVYLMVGLGSLGLAVYVLIGAWANFLGSTPWSVNVAWWLVLLLLGAGAFAAVGVTCLVVSHRYHRPPSWARPLLRSTTLTRVDHVRRPLPPLCR
jgi:hypothetical protein